MSSAGCGFTRFGYRYIGLRRSGQSLRGNTRGRVGCIGRLRCRVCSCCRGLRQQPVGSDIDLFVFVGNQFGWTAHIESAKCLAVVDVAAAPAMDFGSIDDQLFNIGLDGHG